MLKRRIHSRTSRRASVLVIVVAVLMMIALIGTAYIATARLDRYAAQDHVRVTQTDAVRDQYVELVERLVREALRKDFDNDITSPRMISWLASRTPSGAFLNNSPVPVPFWRHLSGMLDESMRQPFETFDSPLVPANMVGQRQRYYDAHMHSIAKPSNRPGGRPTWVTLTYPDNYPVERYRGKTRTFPAMEFGKIDPAGRYQPEPSAAGPYLAADADGDGIADAMLWKLTPFPVNGVTYYAAVRIIDNGSAINVNTAWSRNDDFEYSGNNGLGPPVPAPNRGFFLSNIGLMELLGFADNRPQMQQLINAQIGRINEYRFGYNQGDWFKGPVRAGERMVEGSESEPANPRGERFSTQGEALSMQLGRRLANPGINQDPGMGSGSRSLFPYRAFPEADGASLAYRFCMQPMETASGELTLSDFEYQTHFANQTESDLKGMSSGRREDVRGFDAVVRMAPNYSRFSYWGSDQHFRFFPANATDLWFNYVNVDGDPAGLTEFQDPVTGQRRLRAIRTILTTHSAVTMQVNPRDQRARWGRGGFERADKRLTHPGMPYNDAPQPYEQYGIPAWQRGEPYQQGDFVMFNGVCYMARRQHVSGTLNPEQDAAQTPPSGSRLWDYQPLVSNRTKTSINTAGFPGLWRAFYQVMDAFHDEPNGPWSFYDTPAERTSYNPYVGMQFDSGGKATSVDRLSMFRSSIRDPRSSNVYRLTPQQMMLLRSALAAINTISMMDDINDPTRRQEIPWRDITLYDVDNTPGVPHPSGGGTPGANNPVPQYRVTVYGGKPQPFITEVYANNDAHAYHETVDPQDPSKDKIYQNTEGYIAVELYNPYDVEIDLSKWKLAYLERSSGFGTASQELKEIKLTGTDKTLPVIPAKSYLLLESFGSSKGGVIDYRPPSSRLPLTGDVSQLPRFRAVKIPELSNAMDKELIILRPVKANVQGTIELRDMVPVDQFDFTGLKTSTTAAKTWHYVRPTVATRAWQLVYPGRYDGRSSSLRHQGTRQVTYNPGSFDPTRSEQENQQAKALDPWNPPTGTLGGPFQHGNVVPPELITLRWKSSATLPEDKAENPKASYDEPCTIQWFTPSTVCPPARQSNSWEYPYGGFARNGDILQVPFIGAYKIQLLKRGNVSGPNVDLGELEHDEDVVLELNSVTMDAAFAEDGDPTNNYDPSGQRTDLEQVGRFCPLRDAPDDPYRWTVRLFNYLDVLSPADDYLPNINPIVLRQSGTFNSNVPWPVPTERTDAAHANQGYDDQTPVHGKININTAPTRALEMLPIAAISTGQNAGRINVADTRNLAREIALFREYNRPFRSLFDLNLVPEFADTVMPGRPPTRGDGDITPDTAQNVIRDDFERKFMMLNRISNLVTTRSDTFTVYILVQGWREAGTDLPSLDWEQRKAYIMDRSTLDRATRDGDLKIIPVPAD